MEVPEQETRNVSSSTTGVIGNCELHNVDAGNHTCVLWKSSEHPDPLRHLIIPFLLFLKYIYENKILIIQIWKLY